MTFFLAIVLSMTAPAIGSGKPRAAREVVHREARFKLTAPAGWSETLLGPAELGEGAAGAVLKSSPAARGEEEPSITVIFYAAGNPHFKDAADYLARQTEPLPVTPAGEETGPVTAASLGTLPAKSLTRTRPVGRPEAAVRRGVKLKALLTVADGPGGFYVATCSAPAPRWKAAAPAFQKALASFTALPAPEPRPR